MWHIFAPLFRVQGWHHLPSNKDSGIPRNYLVRWHESDRLLYIYITASFDSITSEAFNLATRKTSLAAYLWSSAPRHIRRRVSHHFASKCSCLDFLSKKLLLFESPSPSFLYSDPHSDYCYCWSDTSFITTGFFGVFLPKSNVGFWSLGVTFPPNSLNTG